MNTNDLNRKDIVDAIAALQELLKLWDECDETRTPLDSVDLPTEAIKQSYRNLSNKLGEPQTDADEVHEVIIEAGIAEKIREDLEKWGPPYFSIEELRFSVEEELQGDVSYAKLVAKAPNGTIYEYIVRPGKGFPTVLNAPLTEKQERLIDDIRQLQTPQL